MYSEMMDSGASRGTGQEAKCATGVVSRIRLLASSRQVLTGRNGTNGLESMPPKAGALAARRCAVVEVFFGTGTGLCERVFRRER